MAYERFKPPETEVADIPPSPAPRFPSGLVARVASVPLVVIACFWLYGNAMASVSDALFPYVMLLPRQAWLWRLAVANLNLPVGIAGAILLAYPVARIYGKYSVHVAVLILLPILVLRAEVLLSSPFSVRTLVLSWELCTVALPLVLGVALARRTLSRNRVRDREAL